jgi:hypothetical protein
MQRDVIFFFDGTHVVDLHLPEDRVGYSGVVIRVKVSRGKKHLIPGTYCDVACAGSGSTAFLLIAAAAVAGCLTLCIICTRRSIAAVTAPRDSEYH